VHVPRLWILAGIAALALACGGKSQPAPPATSPAPGQTVTANNRLGWDQAAADAVELAAIRYAVYVDGVRSELTDVSCATTTATNGKYECSARLPSMMPGPHLLELTAFVVVDGNVMESPKSSGIQVIFTAATTTPSRPDSSSPAAPGVSAVTERAGSPGRKLAASSAVDFVSDGLDQVSDLAFTTDGRLFVAERTGRIRILRDGALLPTPALEVRREADVIGESAASPRGAGAVLSIAIDPQFDRTHHVYVLATAVSPEGALSFLLARYREAGDTLADRAILLHDVPAASPEPAGALRFGPDGKLYVALDAAGNSRLSGDLASPNGKVLRLNNDGTTPDDQAAASPLYSSPYHSPRGLGWDDSGILWIVDAGGAAGTQLKAVGLSAASRQKRGVTKAIVALPQPDEPSALLVFDDSVLVGSARGIPLVRSRVDAADPTRIVRTEALLQDTIEGVQALAIGPDGAVYFATAGAVGRLALR